MTSTQEEREAIRREAHLVANTLHGGIKVYRRECWQCEKKFIANAEYIRLCSDKCLSAFLKSKDIYWYPATSPGARWNFEPPAIMNPVTVENLTEWARKLVRLVDGDA